MKKIFLLSTFAWFILCSSTLFAQKEIEKHWGKKGFDGAFSAAAAPDGGYIISGLTKSQGDTVGDIIVIKTNAHGDTTWTLKYGGPKLEGGNGVSITADGGYLVTGHTEDFGAKDCDAFMMKLDKNGNREWFNVYGGDSDDISESAIELTDGSFVFAGITASYGNTAQWGNRHVYVVKTDSKGKTTWEKHFGGAGVEYAYSLAKTNDNGFLVAGFTTSWGQGEDDGWLLKLNGEGDTLWTRMYKSGGGTRFFQILPTADKGYMMAGYIYPTKGSKSQGLMLKLDAEGKELWQTTFGGAIEDIAFYGVAQLPNGNYMLTGVTRKLDTDGNVYILSTDPYGKKLSDNIYGGSHSYANCIAVQGNDSYLAAGTTSKWGDTDGDMYYMEMDNTQSGIDPGLAAAQNVLIYPDPVTSGSVLKMPVTLAGVAINLDIMNARGQVIIAKQLNADEDYHLSRNGYAAGLYFYELKGADGTVFRGKFMVQ